MKIYGPYTRKDGRMHMVVVNDDKTKTTISYPKYIMPVPCPTCTLHCCKGCHSAKGYFVSDFPWNDKEGVNQCFEEMKQKYGWTSREETEWTENWLKEDQGFFVAGKGCRIPFKERSKICVGFTCHDMTAEQRDAGAKLHEMLWNNLKGKK